MYSPKEPESLFIEIIAPNKKSFSEQSKEATWRHKIHIDISNQGERTT